MKIIHQKENTLFNRKEIYADIESSTTPKKQEIEKLLSEKFGVPSENVEVKKVGGKFGSKIFNVVAFVYDSNELKEQIEVRPKKKAAAAA